MTNQKLGLKEILNLQLQSLVSILNADFSAIAFYDPINLEFRWKLAIGSLNNRYTSIVVNSAKGICGRTLKTRRPFIITDFPEELHDEFIEFPILIIEELKSAVAVPLLFQTQFIGVLLIGQRTYREFNPVEVKCIEDASEKILHSYLQKQQSERTNPEGKKELKKSVLSSYFADAKEKRGDELEIYLLDQRITILSDETQQSLISIFIFLFDCIFLKESHSRVKVIIELKSEHQFAIQIETNTHIEFSDENFSFLADKVREIHGSIEIVYDNKITKLTMNFFLSLLLDDEL